MRKTVMAMVCVAVTGGAAGCGGEDSGDEYESASSEGAAGGPGAEQALNGCDAASAEDHTGEDAVAIATDGFSYSPACVRVSAGTRVTIQSNFASHPLEPGNAATREADDGSPIVPTAAGTSVDVVFVSAGAFGFYCQVHAPTMAGAVFVE